MSILETTYAVCQYPPKELDKKAEVKTSIDPMYILMRIMSSLPSDNDERDGMRCQISYLDNLHSQNARDPAPTYFYSKRVLEFLRSLHLIPGWKILQDGTLTAKTATAPLTLINNFFRTIPVPIASNFSIISIPLVSSFIGNTKSFHAEVIQMLRVLASRPPARDVKDMNIVIRPSSDILDWQDSLQHQKFEISGIAGMRIHLAVSYLGFRTMDAHVRSTIVKQMESLNTVLAASAGSCRAAIHGEPQPPRLIGLPNEVIGKILDQLLPHSSPDIIESHDETGRIRGSPSLSLLLASRSTSGCAQNHADRLLRTRVVRLSTKYGTESIRKYLVPTAIHYPLVNQITHFRIDMHHISMLCKSDAIDGTRHHAPKSDRDNDCAPCYLPKLSCILNHIFQYVMVPRCERKEHELRVDDCGVLEVWGPFFDPVQPRVGAASHRDYQIHGPGTTVSVRLQYNFMPRIEQEWQDMDQMARTIMDTCLQYSLHGIDSLLRLRPWMTAAQKGVDRVKVHFEYADNVFGALNLPEYAEYHPHDDPHIGTPERRLDPDFDWWN